MGGRGIHHHYGKNINLINRKVCFCFRKPKSSAVFTVEKWRGEKGEMYHSGGAM
jgi:hypothetical protein